MDNYNAAFWAFTERADVRDLTDSLFNGLLHPLEYARAVQNLARGRLGAVTGNPCRNSVVNMVLEHHDTGSNE